MAKRVEFVNDGPGYGVSSFNWKMSVDNPGATDQMKPGHKYTLVLYPAERYDRNGAIAAAHAA